MNQILAMFGYSIFQIFTGHNNLAFFHELFQGEAKSIAMQISFVMLIVQLFSDQISGGRSRWRGGGGMGCLRKGTLLSHVEESQAMIYIISVVCYVKKYQLVSKWTDHF